MTETVRRRSSLILGFPEIGRFQGLSEDNTQMLCRISPLFRKASGQAIALHQQFGDSGHVLHPDAFVH
jgi:hypothetical protein